jgi:hypothetical protein
MTEVKWGKTAKGSTFAEIVSDQDEKKEKLAILAFFHNHYRVAPWWNSEYEIWGCNCPQDGIERFDRWFEFHSMYNIRHRKEAPNHLKWLKNCDKPIYMKKKYANIPMSVKYPIQAMVDEFGPIFTNTIDYMLALAITEGFKEIAIYGAAFTSILEYIRERQSYIHLLGIAKGKGITIRQTYDILRINNLYCYPEIDIEKYWFKAWDAVAFADIYKNHEEVLREGADGEKESRA